jgi:ribosomal protein S15P/S13E
VEDPAGGPGRYRGSRRRVSVHATALKQATTSGKGYRTRYYVCSTHHNGHKDRCSKRYTVPASVVEEHLFGLIMADLAKLRDDEKLHQYVADELRRVRGGNTDARDQLRRQLANLDQKLAKLRDHLTALDPDTATDLGLYEQARMIGEQRRDVEAELTRIDPPAPDLPDVEVLRRRTAAAFDQLQEIIDGGAIEEKRELLAAYVQKIEADPHSSTVQISLYPTLFSRGIAGKQRVSGHCFGVQTARRVVSRCRQVQRVRVMRDDPL